ncbi:unnamed protein product [Soboliphyme baturini]|uniref:Sphingomyelin phosphodiesterase 4 n=1 Tax=Soboliphyme baturini TaxID=241478 RepID=A0A183J5G6_9BILA|nr:unnamed protein product [Soboliphyme baturini]
MHRFLYFSPSPSPLSDLKTGVLQPNLRRRMVDLFEYHFCRWPLDASFRSLLETWLAYIQPWRAGNIGPRPLPNPTTTTTRIHVKWTTFMRENKHVYETFFRLTLLRFARMDFGRNVKNVYLIHRLCEVFNQDGFFDLLKKTSADTVANIDVNNVGSYLEGRDPLVKPQSFWTCQDTGSLVSNVVALIETELSMARSYLEDLRASERSLDWPQFLYSYFFQPSTELKAETLQQVLYKLARVDSEHLVMSSPDAPVVDCDEFPLVGDVLDMMSRLINFRCTSFFEQLYAKRGWVGKLAHHFLEAPTVKQVRVEEEQKDSASQREAFPRTSPPRISLRRFSSVRFLFHLSVFVLAVFLLFRWNPLYIFFMYVAVRILLSCVLCLLME